MGLPDELWAGLRDAVAVGATGRLFFDLPASKVVVSIDECAAQIVLPGKDTPLTPTLSRDGERGQKIDSPGIPVDRLPLAVFLESGRRISRPVIRLV